MFQDLRPYPNTACAAPPGWARRRIKTLLTEVDRRSNTGDERLLSLRAKAGLVDHIDAGGKPIEPSALVGYKVVRPGELVMNRMRAAAGVFGLAERDGLVSPDYALFQIGADVEPAYLLALLRIPVMAERMRLRSRGMGTGESGFLRLYSDAFGAIPIVLPPVEEQRAIVKYLAHTHQRINKAIATKQRLMRLLDEQRSHVVDQLVSRGANEHTSYTETGNMWLSSVPSHWRYVPVKRVIGGGPTNGVSPQVSESGELKTLSLAAVRNGRVHGVSIQTLG